MMQPTTTISIVNRIASGGDDEVEEALRRAQSVLGVDTAKKKEVTGVQPRGGPLEEIETALLESYLPPRGIFADAVLSVICDGDRAESVKQLAQGLLLDVHPICAIGAMVSYLTRLDRSNGSAKAVWSLLEKVMFDDFSGCVVALCDGGMWKSLLPRRRWEDCCYELVGWIVALFEMAKRVQLEEGRAFLPSALLPQMLHTLLQHMHKGTLNLEEIDGRKLMGTFLQRCLNRGFGQEVAQAVMQEYHCILKDDRDPAVLSYLLECIKEPYATEKFLQQMIGHSGKDIFSSLLKALTAAPSASTSVNDSPLHVLFHRILLKGPLSKDKARAIIELLVTDEGKLMDVVGQLAKMWSDKSIINHTPLPQQSYLTFLLTSLIPSLPGDFAQVGDARISRALLQGVSNRLESSIETIRFQGMRVAHAIAAREAIPQPLFSDLDLDFTTLQGEEKWETDSDKTSESNANREGNTSYEVESKVPDSDDESDFCSSVADEDDLEPLETETETILMKGQRPVTLLDLHQDLKKSEKPMTVIAALKRLTVLIKQQPAELPSMARDLGRTLIHVPLPDWIHEELKRDDAFALQGLKSSSAVRVRCLGILLVAAPMHCGDFVASMIASKQVAEHQRLEILESMRHAAKELSTSSVPLTDPSGCNAQEEAQKSGTSRVWGVRSLAAAKVKRQTTFKNHFVDVAGLWMTSLLVACQTVTHGFSFLERSPMVLGSVLITISTFAECASQSMMSTALALSAFPLFRAIAEQKANDCYLRRCTFQSLAVLIKGIPTPRLSSAIAQPMLSETQNEADRALGAMLVWIKAQSECAVRSDVDETCRCLAAHCLHICADVSKKALEFHTDEDSLLPSPATLRYRIPQLFQGLSLNKANIDPFSRD